MTLLPAIQSFEDYEREALALIKPAFKSRYGMLQWADLDRPGEEVEWLVDDLMTVADKSIIAGPSQSGKSFVAIDIGMGIALNKPFMGRHPVQPGLVIYQAGEGARGIKRRLRAYRKHFDVPAAAHVPFVLLQSRVDLFSEDGDTQGFIDEIRAIAAMYPEPLRAVFIDTLSKAQGLADENSGRDMARVLNNIDLIRDAVNAHVCLVHHLNADGTKLRGHTSVFANIDQVLAVTCDKDTKVRTLRTAKMKDGSDDVTVKFELMAISLGSDKHGKEITSCVALPVGEKDALKSQGFDGKAFKPNPGEKTFMAALFKALESHGQQRPPDAPEIPEFKRVVDFKDFRDVYRAMSIKTGEEDSKALARTRQAIKRSGEYLRDAKVVGVHGEFLWWTGRVVHGVPETYPPKQVVRATHVDSDEELKF